MVIGPFVLHPLFQLYSPVSPSGSELLFWKYSPGGVVLIVTICTPRRVKMGIGPYVLPGVLLAQGYYYSPGASSGTGGEYFWIRSRCTPPSNLYVKWCQYIILFVGTIWHFWRGEYKWIRGGVRLVVLPGGSKWPCASFTPRGVLFRVEYKLSATPVQNIGSSLKSRA